ncbi:MAG: YtxH domain-containing protein [Cryomorphaceae bacterium]|nr:YtxH domain-containing protein [Cryomorphaceae bacterium]
MENSNDIGKIIGSVIVGAAIGGVLGILFAPHKGKKTRKKILAKGEDIKDLIKDQFTEMMEQINLNQDQDVAAKIK